MPQQTIAVQLQVHAPYYREAFTEGNDREYLRQQMRGELQDQIEELDLNALLNLALSNEPGAASLQPIQVVMAVA